ncbi:MAG: AI-2E family transporter [Acidobacteria bacterium]|nr:AI-2E family transporter [Acidobacteriota bacterium]
MSPSPSERIRLDLPWLTILKILIAAALVWIWLQVWPIVMVVLVSLVLAVTLEPAVGWLERWRFKRGLAVLVVGAVTLATFGAFLFAAVAPITEETKVLVDRLASFQESVAVRVPVAVARVVRRGPQDPAQMMSEIAAKVPDIGIAVLSAAAMTLFAFILTLYLLADGRRTYEWVIAYVPRAHRAKVNETVVGVTGAVFAYAAGNLLTSIFAAVFVLVSLTLLKVPAALMLAVLAGVCDFVPIIGFFVALTPAVLIALTISPGTAAAVAGLYVLCSAIENYAIVPKVYGHHLKVSRVAVLLGLVTGAALGGIIGALLALPVVAAYPIVERIWLRESLGKSVLAEHARLEREGE